jgi:hypothetical protein
MATLGSDAPLATLVVVAVIVFVGGVGVGITGSWIVLLLFCGLSQTGFACRLHVINYGICRVSYTFRFGLRYVKLTTNI